MTKPNINILRIDSSARRDGSETRALNDAIIRRIGATSNTTVIHRDLAVDVIVIGAPIYNFSIPAVLKAWVDMVARAKVTFRHSENGSEGLLKNKQAYVMMAHGPGGTTIGSSNDFASPYLKHLLGFIGIHDVEFISVDDVKEDSRRLDDALAGAQSHSQRAA